MRDDLVQRGYRRFAAVMEAHNCRMHPWDELPSSIQEAYRAIVQEMFDALPEGEARIVTSIRTVYSEAVWPTPPEEHRAVDAVAADCLREMASAMAGIAIRALQEWLRESPP